MTSSVEDCTFIDLPSIGSSSGSITPVEGGEHVPFEIARVFFLYDIVAGARRGGHAHRRLQQVLVAAMGSFRVVLDDGRDRHTVELNQPHVGLYLPPLIWQEMIDFASGSICLVLASDPYDEADYLRDHDEFRRLAVPSP